MINKHNKDDLRQMQSLPLEAKIRMSQRRIRDWYEYWDGNVYVSFSGGKDSTVLKHLVENTPGVYDVPVVFVDTGLEYPEVRMFATERADVVLRPEMRFDEVIKKYGYPVFSKEVSNNIEYGRKALERGDYEKVNRYLYGMRKKNTGEDYTFGKLSEKALDFALNSDIPASKKCCDIMKKNPVKKYEKETGRKAIIGIMASESDLRTQLWTKYGCNAYENKKRPTSNPMSFWTENDVLEYIRSRNLPYASVYGDIIETEIGLKTTGCNRTGCMFCMYGCTRDPIPNRFQRMKETHPRQYEYCMKPIEEKGLGLRKVLDYIGVPYE